MNLLSFYDAPNEPSQKLIPNNFFQTYKTSLVDEEHGNLLRQFRQANQDFNFYFYDDLRMDDYMARNWRHRKIYEIYKLSKFGASKADIWRYCILYDMGGVYLDFDSHINFKLNSIPNDTEEIVSFENNLLSSLIDSEYTPNFEAFLNNVPRDGTLSHVDNIALNWLLVFKRRHPLLLKVIENIEEYSEFFSNKKFTSVLLAVTNCTGPVMFTRTLWEYARDTKKINQCGIDFNGQAIFKAIPPNGTYSLDTSRYANFSNTEILDTEKILLNLGCGDDIYPLYYNYDAVKKAEGVKELDINKLNEFHQANSVDEILAKDVLEHVGFPTAISWIQNWAGLLKKGGVLTIKTPCLDIILEAFTQSKIHIEDLNYYLFAGVSWENGSAEWDTNKTTTFDWHRCCFSYDALSILFNNAGLSIAGVELDRFEDMVPGMKNHGLNITIRGIKS